MQRIRNTHVYGVNLRNVCNIQNLNLRYTPIFLQKKTSLNKMIETEEHFQYQ